MMCDTIRNDMMRYATNLLLLSVTSPRGTSPALQTRSPTRFCLTGCPSFFPASCASRSAPAHNRRLSADSACCYQTRSVQRCTPCARSHTWSSFLTRCHRPSPPRDSLAPCGAVLWGAPLGWQCQRHLKEGLQELLQYLETNQSFLFG